MATEESQLYIDKMYVYPVKSCSPVEVKSWEVSSSGLKYDRQWMIIDSSGVFFSLRRIPAMYWIKPSFDLENGFLCLDHEFLSTLRIPLALKGTEKNIPAKLFNKKYFGYDCGDEAANWCDEALNETGCRLIRIADNIRLGEYDGEALSYVDASQYLVVCEESAKLLCNKLNEEYDLDENDQDFWTVEDTKDRFRANFYVKGTKEAFEEESWKKIEICNIEFKHHEPCKRCKVTCVKNDETAHAGSEPLEILRKIRKEVLFGIYLGCAYGVGGKISVNSSIKVQETQTAAYV